MPSSSSRKRRKKRLVSKLPIIGLAALSVATLAVVGMAFTDSTDTDIAAVESFNSTPAPTVAPTATDTRLKVARPEGAPLRVLVAGDSLSQGRFATAANEAYVPRLREALSAGGEVVLDVIGNSGKTSAEVTPDIPKAPYDLVILELGTNDAMKEDVAQKFHENYRALVTAVRDASPNAALMCAGSWQTDYRASAVDPQIYKQCTDQGGKFVRLNSLFNNSENRGPDKAQGVYGVGDNFHPNSKGHEAIAALLLSELAL